MLMAAMALLIAPFGLAVAWEWWMDRVTEPRQMETQSPLRVVGEVVTLPRVRGPRKTPALRPRDTGRLLYEESVDSLRTCMSLSSLACDARVVAFASAVSREGKTSLAVQFALSAARASRERVLIIDGDMRCPDIHKAFDVPLSWGLVDVLSNNVTLSEAIRVSQIDLIDVLPAGKLVQSPHQLMGGDAFHRLVEEAKSMYRYVVIDTPPVLAAGEALVLAKEADAALVCARRDFSRLSQVRAAHQRLLDAGAQPIGAVLNGVSASSYRFRYGTYDYTK
jgi:capsular exopolysaccharide synthesis family protein